MMYICHMCLYSVGLVSVCMFLSLYELCVCIHLCGHVSACIMQVWYIYVRMCCVLYMQSLSGGGFEGQWEQCATPGLAPISLELDVYTST
jgi:hypothetical protein